MNEAEFQLDWVPYLAWIRPRSNLQWYKSDICQILGGSSEPVSEIDYCNHVLTLAGHAQWRGRRKAFHKIDIFVDLNAFRKRENISKFNNAFFLLWSLISKQYTFCEIQDDTTLMENSRNWVKELNILMRDLT